MKPLLIGFCGGSGSGKTTLAEIVAKKLGDKSVIVNMDSFYKYQANTTYEERCLTNYDHPNSIDGDLFTDSMEMLKEGKDTQIPVYDFTIHNRREGEWEYVKAAPVIIIDGILLFAFPEIVDLLDLKVYVDAPADVRILRRLVRDVKKRGRTVESVVDQYLTTVKPMHDLFIEPKKNIADIIVPLGGKNEVAAEMIVDYIEKELLRER